jgi:hypothetical protein
MAVGAASQHVVETLLLKVLLPGQPERNLGVFLFDGTTGNLYFRIREDFEGIANPDEAEMLSHLSAHFHKRLDELGDGGGAELLQEWESQLSNVLQLSDRKQISVGNIQAALDRLFEENCPSLNS